MHCTAQRAGWSKEAGERFRAAADAPGLLRQVSFRNPIRYGLKKELFIASEGMYTGQVRLCWLHAAPVQLLCRRGAFYSRGPPN